MRKIRNGLQNALAASLSVVLALGLCGCKPTDFFTETVISPLATEVDEDNPNRTVVNSPDSNQESGELSALDWSDASSVSREVQNLVVYGSEPTTTLSTHHSLFDLQADFPGIEASDGVRLVYGESSEIDHEAEADEDDVPVDDATSVSQGGSESEPEASVAESSQATTQSTPETPSQNNSEQTEPSRVTGDTSQAGNTPGGSGDITQPGESGGESGNGSQSGEGSGDDVGNQNEHGESPTPGPGADVSNDDDYNPVWSPGNALVPVQQSERVAVLGGGNVASLVRAIGGAGRVCAVTEYAWYGKNSQGMRSTYSSYGELFASDADAPQILWSKDGSSPGDLVSVEALVQACGEGGVIVYDQLLGYRDELFTAAQIEAIEAAHIQCVPVELSSAQGIVDAATVVGNVLQGDAQTRAMSFKRSVQSIINGAANTVVGSESSTPVCFVATAAESGLSYVGGGDIDVSGVVLFQNARASVRTPLATWGQAAGVVVPPSDYASYQSSELALLWPFCFNATVPDGSLLVGGSAGDARSRWLSAGSQGEVSAMLASVRLSTVSENLGLGTYLIPYLVVCAADLDGDRSLTTGEVKSAVVESMLSRASGGPLTPYSVLPYDSESAVFSYSPYDKQTELFSSIGMYGDRPVLSNWPNPFYGAGLSVSDVVRENPVGLVGSWVEGSAESVLEAAWLAELYARSASGSDYEPSRGELKATVDGVECTGYEQIVKQFYRAYYDLDDSVLDAAFDGSIPDQFEGLS